MDKPNYSSAPLSGTKDRSRERQSNFRLIFHLHPGIISPITE